MWYLYMGLVILAIHYIAIYLDGSAVYLGDLIVTSILFFVFWPLALWALALDYGPKTIDYVNNLVVWKGRNK